MQSDVHLAVLIAALLTLVAALGAAGPASGQPAPGIPADTVVAGRNDDPRPGPTGAMPYEMVQRKEPRAPLFDFADVTDWAAEGHGVDVRLYRTSEQRLWRPYAAKVVYRATGAAPDPWFVIRPREPIPLPDPWDCLDVWGWGNGPVSAIVQGSDGQRTEIGLGSTDAQYWFLLHARVAQAIQRPAHLVGLRFRNAGAPKDTVIYLGPGYAYREVLAPLKFAPWPRRLPFPTRPETILPINKAAGFANRVERRGDTYVLAYVGKDCALAYEYRPVSGTLGDISLVYRGRRTLPCAGGGVQLVSPDGLLPADSPAVHRKLVRVRRDGDVVSARWRLTAGQIQTEVVLRLRIWQKSLVVDISADAPVAGRVALGHAEGVASPQLFRVPFLGYGGNDPRILLAGGLFYFAQFDWYRSDASALYGGAETTADTAVYNGGAEYTPKTDGRRNPVRERLFINVSPDVQEVLPTIPNPPSPMRAVMADRLWRVKHGENYAAEIAEARRFAAYGMDRVACRYHEEQWRDGEESFTFRVSAAPGKGGDAALRDEVSAIKACGWLVGLYTNFTDFAPVNANWDPDRVSRTPDGNWPGSWMRCVAPKPMYAVEAARYFAPRIARKFGTNHSYCDVHTAVTPFSRVDYDARVPGAGMFRRVFECFGRVLYEQKFAYRGPVYSEGNNHWWYAGLVDGNYAQLGSTASWRDPMFVDFDLLHMHPLSMDSGMGEIGMYYRGPLPDLAVERFRAVTLAYGHLGYLDYQGPSAQWPELIKTYYLQHPLQSHYVMVPVDSIRYGDAAGRLMESSRALSTGAYRANRVRVVYRGGFTVYVNGSPDPWEVAGPRGRVRLPEWGYLAFSGDRRTVSSSRLVDRAGGPVRVDWCVSPDMLYLDSRGAGFIRVGPLGVDGAVALKRQGTDWWVMPATEAREIAVDLSALGLPRGATPLVRAFDADGGPLAAPDTAAAGGVLTLRPGAHPAFRYRLSAAGRGR